MEQVDADRPYLHPKKIVQRLVGAETGIYLTGADIQQGVVNNGSRKAPGMFRLHSCSRACDILEACRNER